MPDQRSVMKEFRSLEEKRRSGSLTPEEEARHAVLRDLIGPEMGAGGLRPGFDVNAAAAKLRDSLLPAGLRNRPPPPPEPAPLPAAEPEPETDATSALESAFAEQPFAPLEPSQEPDPLFDPSSLGAEPAAEAGWDPNQPYDPNAQAAWDPNLPPEQDPNAAAGWDPNQPYDPNAQAAWDPNLPPEQDDPNAAAGWDPNQPYDPNAQAAWDPNLAPEQDDPNAAAGWDPNPPKEPVAGDDWAVGEPLESGASFDEGEPEGEVAAAAEGVPAGDLGDGLPPEGWSAEPPLAAAPEAGPAGEYDADPWASAEETSPESALHFDPVAASAIGPGDLPGAGDDLEPSGLGLEPGYPGDPPPDGSGYQATHGVPADVRGWQPESFDDGDAFRLESGGSFDAATSAVAPDWAMADAATPWQGAATPTPPPAGDATEPPAELGPAFVEELEPIEPLPGEAEEAWAGSAGEEAPPPEAAAWDPGAGEPEAPFEAPEPEAIADAGVVAGDDWAEPAPTPGGELPFPEEGAAPAPGGTAPVFDFSRPDFSAEEEAFADASGSAEPEAAVPETAPAEPPAEELPPFDAEPEAAAAEPTAAPSAEEVPLEELPTIEGEDILEEIPPEELAAPAAPPHAPLLVPGSHRVVVHTVEGHVRRGVLTDVDLAAGSLALSPQQGGAADPLDAEQVKAIFFMLAPGEKAPPAEGKKVRVTFRDGRQVAGYGPEYTEEGPGFFMIPADTRTNTGRIWVYRAAVRQVVTS